MSSLGLEEVVAVITLQPEPAGMKKFLDSIENNTSKNDQVSRKEVLWLVDIAREAIKVTETRKEDRRKAIKRMKVMLRAGPSSHLEAVYNL